MSEPVNLQVMLSEYRHGKRELPTYSELLMVDIQIAAQQAQIAALRASLRAVLHEQAMIAYIARIP